MQSPQLNELFAALAKAQGEYKIAGKNKENPFFKSSYASYEDLVDATRPALEKHGLSICSRVVVREDKQYFHMILAHASGQYIISESKIAPTKTDIQSEGSYRSYQQRYAYKELTGVVISDDHHDDDGESVMNRSSSNNAQYITMEQEEILKQELEGEVELRKDMFAKLRISSLNQIPKASFSSILARIREIKSIK